MNVPYEVIDSPVVVKYSRFVGRESVIYLPVRYIALAFLGDSPDALKIILTEFRIGRVELGSMTGSTLQPIFE